MPVNDRSDRLAALEAMVAADPDDALARYLLGQECRAAGRAADAARHLAAYCETFQGDKGAAFLALAAAREETGDVAGAREALDLGIENARAHRHRQLLESLQAERERLEGR